MEHTVPLRQHFPDVLYSTVERAQSRSRSRIFDDRGVLDLTESGFVFRGRANVICAKKIAAVEETRQKISFARIALVLLISHGIILAWSIYFAYVTASIESGVFLFLTYSIVVVSAAIVTAVLTQRSRWIQVQFQDKEDNYKKILVAPGNAVSGFSSRADTKQLYLLLKNYVVQGEVK